MSDRHQDDHYVGKAVFIPWVAIVLPKLSGKRCLSDLKRDLRRARKVFGSVRLALILQPNWRDN